MPDTGKIVGVNGNMLTVEFPGVVTQNEVGYALLGDIRLKCEVIRVRGNRADLQVFESTNDVKVGDAVEFTGELLSVELGPGLLAQVVDDVIALHDVDGQAGVLFREGGHRVGQHLLRLLAHAGQVDVGFDVGTRDKILGALSDVDAVVCQSLEV